MYALKLIVLAGCWLALVVWADGYFTRPESLIAAVGVITAGCWLAWKFSHRKRPSVGN